MERDGTIVYCVRCEGCDTLRIGKKAVAQDVHPTDASCPQCGETDFSVPAIE